MSNLSQQGFWQGLPALEKPRPASVPKYEYEPQEAEIEAQAILSAARTEAATLLADAKKRSEALLAGANAEAAFLKSQALEQGAVEGFERAKQTVQAELEGAWNDRVDEMRADVQLLIDSIAIQRKELWEQSEIEIIAFVIEMAKRVVKVEVQQNSQVIGEMIRHALRRVADKENIRIRVNPEELETVRADRKDLLLVLDGARQLEIVDDRRIGRGGCVIETDAGTIDARIDTQFAQIADRMGVVRVDAESTK